MTKLPVAFLRRPTSIRALLVTAACLLLVLLPAGVASAHTSFEQSSPANGETISEPVEQITIQFTGDSEYDDDGFTVLTPDGLTHTPTTVTSPDQRVFALTFDPPLTGGEIGVRWSVNAPDKHPIDGAFSFTVTAPATAPTTAATAAAIEDPPLAVIDEPDAMVTADGSAMDMSSPSMSLDEFLAEQPARSGEGTARWGRLIGFAAITLLIGGGAFAATTFRGRRSEIDRAIGVLRVLGVALAAGALLEYLGAARIAEASIVGYWSSQPGMAALLRGVGGLAIAAGLAAVTVPVRARRPAHSLSSAVNPTMEYEREERAQFWSDEHVPRRGRRNDRPSSHRGSTESAVIRKWVLDRSSSAAYLGVAIAIISFWFDGHTVSKGIRPLHAIVNSVHVIAGSVWLGGVVAMAVVLWARHRAGVAPRGLEMVVRFSGIATVALGAVIAAGGLMAFLVLDSVGELFSTQWGQILLLKSAAAALAMVGGAYNHFRLLPALEAEPNDPKLIEHLRTSVTSEAIMLGFVIVVTASLVAAAS